MTFSKIRIDSRDDCAKALHGMMQRGKITVLRDQTFLVPSPALEWIRSERIPYTLLETLHQDDAVQTLRDHIADPVQ